jgi:hypothetical protein
MNSIPRRTIRTTGRAALLWTLGLFVLGQAVLGAWLNRRHPEMFNPTFEFRYNRLQQCLQEAPGHPLVLVLGSSRPANGFSPSSLVDWQPRNGPTPVVFNFATLGGGPVRELLTYRRLRARGIQPALMLVEVWPGLWPQEGPLAERFPILTNDLCIADLPVVAHLYKQGWSCFAKACNETLTPILHSRRDVLYRYVPFMVPRYTGDDVKWAAAHWGTLDRWGWLPHLWPKPEGEKFVKKIEEDWHRIEAAVALQQCPPEVDWSVRQLLMSCRDSGTKVALIFMPEHSILRGWYSPQLHRVYLDYLGQIQKEFGVPTIDTRDWVNDEGFLDSCHMLPDAAKSYTARFGLEVLRPLLEGKPLPASVSLRVPAEASNYPGTFGPVPVAP